MVELGGDLAVVEVGEGGRTCEGSRVAEEEGIGVGVGGAEAGGGRLYG